MSEQTPLIDIGPAAKRPSKRRENDRYLTPPMATEALKESFPEISGRLLIDPCCGDKRMAGQLSARFPLRILNDIAAGGRDATQPDAWATWRDDARCYDGGVRPWSVSNLPFNRASAIVPLALEAGFACAFLLRLTFLEPTSDRQWLTRTPPTALLILPRIDFIGAGQTDSAPCAWMIWADGVVKPGIRVVRAADVGQEALL